MRHYLDIPVEKIQDEDLCQLVQEMTVAGQGTPFPSQSFIPFLIGIQRQWLLKNKRTPFHLNFTRPGFLETPIGKIQSESIKALCEELAEVIEEALEMHINRKLMSFLNHVVRTLDQREKRVEKRRSKRKS